MIHKTTRSILSVLLAVLLLVTSIPLTPAFAGEVGAVPPQSANSERGGLEQDGDGVYQIGSADDLRAFAEKVNGGETDANTRAELTANIDLSEICSEEEGDSWTPIGNSEEYAYTGTFNGQNFKISGLTINNSRADDQGLFGYVGRSGIVQNLTVSGSVKGDDHVGGVVGYNDEGRVENCHNIGSVSGERYVGGVVGDNRGSVENCHNIGEVSGSGNSVGGVGGVVGNNDGGRVKNCYNTVTVTGTGTDDYLGGVGGVVGNNDGGRVENCYNTGSVSGGIAVGGVVGLNDINSSVTNCYNTGTDGVVGYSSGGVVGYNSGTVENCYNTGNMSANISVGISGGVVGWNSGIVENCYNTGNVSDGTISGGVVGQNFGSGSVKNCYFLKTADVNVGRPGIGGGSGTSSNVEARTDDAFHSGEVAWLLENGQAEDQTTPVWGQSNLTATTSLPTLIALNPGAAQPVYKVTFKYGYDSVPENEISYTNGSVKFPTFERTGYTFAGWTPTGTTISQDTTFTAQWTANTYTVTLDPNDGTIAEDQNVTTYTYGIGATLPTTVTREGYTFAGWYEKEDLTGDPVIEISATDTGEKEYWAKWTPNTYTVTLHTNDGTIAEGQNISSYTYGIGATLPTSVTREGYTFAGWYEKEDFTGDPVAAIGKDAMGDKTYWAKWEEVEKPEPTPTPTPDPTPSGPSTGDSTGWDDILDELENTAKGDEITIDMGDETKTEFAPEQTTTRAMIVSILARLEGVTTAQAAGFADVDDNDWYATAVNWAASVGVVNGYEDNTFRPNTAITREQLAAILMNYAAYKGYDVSARADLSHYSDADSISSWANDVLLWAVAEGLLTGVTDDTIAPQAHATRAQVAAILQRFLSE